MDEGRPPERAGAPGGAGVRDARSGRASERSRTQDAPPGGAALRRTGSASRRR